MSSYRPHKGRHQWTLKIAELGGKRACRLCGHIAAGREDFFDLQRAKKQGEVAQ